MIRNLMAGGGGTSLNLTVTAYSSSANIPALGVAGYTKIAIVSSTAVGEVILSIGASPTTRNDGSALQSGDTRIIMGYLSNRPFVAMDVFKVNCQGAEQYNGSTWVSVVMYVSIDGAAYVNTGAFLYNSGNLCTPITGGWAARSWAAEAGIPGQAPDITLGSESVTVSYTSVNTKAGVYQIANDIDLTNYSTLKIDSSANGNGFTSRITRLHVGSRSATYCYPGDASIALDGARAVKSLNISAISGARDVYLVIWTIETASPSITMHSLRLE